MWFHSRDLQLFYVVLIAITIQILRIDVRDAFGVYDQQVRLGASLSMALIQFNDTWLSTWNLKEFIGGILIIF